MARMVRRFNLDDVPVCLAFSPDGRSLAAGYGAVVVILETDTGRRSGSLAHSSKVHCVRWGGKGRLLSSLASGPSIRTWEVNGWKLRLVRSRVERSS